jgi:hypothetical protein
VLKTAVGDAINKLLDPIRKAFEENEEWQKVEKLAYPDPNAKADKKNKKKVRSSTVSASISITDPRSFIGESIPSTASRKRQEY